MGRMGIEYALKIVAGETIPAQTYVDPICITADNVAEYLANGQAFQ